MISTLHMRPWVITDSGLGGLSIAARCLQILAEFPPAADSNPTGELVYVNAVPRVDRGYNAMPSRQERLRTFRSLLRQVQRELQPQSIFVACHSLSLFLPELQEEFGEGLDLRGVVEPTLDLGRTVLAETEEDLVIFATPSTVAESVYKNALTTEHPEWSGRIHEQSCPELASSISADAEGSSVQALIRRFVQQALARIATERPVSGILGCTHYGYRAELFRAALAEHGPPSSRILDPNASVAAALASMVGRPESFRFISPYPIPEFERQTVSGFLHPISPAAAKGFLNQEVREGWSNEIQKE